MKMRKLVALVMAALMLCCIIPFTAVAADSSAVLDLTDKVNRVSYSSSQQVWEQNGIVVTNDKGASTSNVGDYGNPGRFYKSSTVTIEYPGMTKIVIDSVTYADNDYAIGWTNSFTADATATVVDGDVTIVLAEPADSFVWEKLTAQSRAYTITVYTGDAGDAPVVPPVEPDEPEQPDTPAIPDGTELTITDAIAMGQTYAHNTFSENKYYVTGVITEIYNDMYGNMKLADEAGNILTIYGTWSEDGSTRFDAMSVKPVVGDTVVLYGIIGQYNGTSQMKNGWIIGIIGGDTPDVPDQPDTPDVPDEPVGSLGVVADPVAGVAYKFGMVQENVSTSDVYYLIGGMNGYYMATGTDAAAAIDVYLEETDGGYYLYAMVDGIKTYINMVVSGTHVNGAYEVAASTVYTFNVESKTVIAIVNDAPYWFGTRNDKTYTTVGPCAVSYAGFYCQFYSAEGGDAPVVPPVEPDEPEIPDVPVEPDDEIDTTIPYMLGMVQENVSTEDVYFINGLMNGYYMDTTTDVASAIVVKLEETDGGYYLYTVLNDAKTYINMVVSGTHVNGAYESAPSTVYTYDWNRYTLVSEVNGEWYAFGTRNDKTYTTMGPVKVSYNGFHADLYYFGDGSDCDHDYELLEEIAPTCGEDGVILYACTICGETFVDTTPATGEHTYDDDYDAYCNVCGEMREVPDVPVYVGGIATSTNSGAIGEKVVIGIQLDVNPGIISAKVKVHFDNTVLKLVEATPGEFSAAGYSWGDMVAANEKGYFIVNWCDATQPNSMAQVLATLTFEILETAQVGEMYSIYPEFDCQADIFNFDDETVWFYAVSGGVFVVEKVAVVEGDVNGDGKVNNRDLGILQKYLNGSDVVVDEVASDLSGDGKLNNRDLGLLQKKLNA